MKVEVGVDLRRRFRAIGYPICPRPTKPKRIVFAVVELQRIEVALKIARRARNVGMTERSSVIPFG